MFWVLSDFVGYFFLAVFLLGLVAIAATFIMPCAWREGGYCDRRRHRIST